MQDPTTSEALLVAQLELARLEDAFKPDWNAIRAATAKVEALKLKALPAVASESVAPKKRASEKAERKAEQRQRDPETVDRDNWVHWRGYVEDGPDWLYKETTEVGYYVEKPAPPSGQLPLFA